MTGPSRTITLISTVGPSSAGTSEFHPIVLRAGKTLLILAPLPPSPALPERGALNGPATVIRLGGTPSVYLTHGALQIGAFFNGKT